MATLTKSYSAKGTFSYSDMQLTEIKKEKVEVHDLASALKEFEGLEVTVSISYKHEIQPVEDVAEEE